MQNRDSPEIFAHETNKKCKIRKSHNSAWNLSVQQACVRIQKPFSRCFPNTTGGLSHQLSQLNDLLKVLDLGAASVQKPSRAGGRWSAFNPMTKMYMTCKCIYEQNCNYTEIDEWLCWRDYNKHAHLVLAQIGQIWNLGDFKCDRYICAGEFHSFGLYKIWMHVQSAACSPFGKVPPNRPEKNHLGWPRMW